MTGQRGRDKGCKKSGGAVKGSQKKLTLSVKQAIMTAYEKAGGTDYLLKVAKENPPVFCGLLAKVVPAEIQADIRTSHSIDLGQAMADADARLSLNHDAAPLAPFQENPHAYIDVTPAKVVADE